jgi:hypothetical protein
MRVIIVMAQQVGPAWWQADILRGPYVAIETIGSPRADSMVAREASFPLKRPDIRLHPTRLAWTAIASISPSGTEGLPMRDDSG